MRYIILCFLCASCYKEQPKTYKVQLRKIEAGSVIVKTAEFTTDFCAVQNDSIFFTTDKYFQAHTDSGSMELLINGNVRKSGQFITYP